MCPRRKCQGAVLIALGLGVLLGCVITTQFLAVLLGLLLCCCGGSLCCVRR